MNDYIEMVSYDRPMDAYVCSDLHGNLNLALQIAEIAQQGNTIFFLGDACDRGENGWEIIKLFLHEPNIIYLLGNHEDMLTKAMRGYFLHQDDEYRYSRAYETWTWNGCFDTEDSILTDDFEVAKKYYQRLNHLPIRAKYINDEGKVIYMSHSGYEFFAYESDVIIDKKDLIWDRNHYYNPAWIGQENEFDVHGHTPIPYLIEEINPGEWNSNSALWYCHTHKIDLDMLTIKTNKICLLNLNTFEETILEGYDDGEL